MLSFVFHSRERAIRLVNQLNMAYGPRISLSVVQPIFYKFITVNLFDYAAQIDFFLIFPRFRTGNGSFIYFLTCACRTNHQHSRSCWDFLYFQCSGLCKCGGRDTWLWFWWSAYCEPCTVEWIARTDTGRYSWCSFGNCSIILFIGKFCVCSIFRGADGLW